LKFGLNILFNIYNLNIFKIYLNYMEIESHKVYLILNIIISVALASSFIAFFFFTYAKNVEKLIVVKNVKYVINDLLDNIVPLIPKSLKDQIIEQIDQIKLPDMTEADTNVENENNKLLVRSKQLYGKVLIGTIILTLIISYIYKFNIIEIVVSNLILLGGIALTEYLFLNDVIANHISADPNTIKHKVISTLLSDPLPESPKLTTEIPPTQSTSPSPTPPTPPTPPTQSTPPTLPNTSSTSTNLNSLSSRSIPKMPTLQSISSILDS